MNPTGATDAEKKSPVELGNSSHPHLSSHENLIIVRFDNDDPGDPVNLSKAWKIFVMISGLLIVLNSTLNSSLPSGAIYYITSSFNVHSDVQNALPISLFLIGYVVGPAIFSPLSEIYGRKLLIVTTFLSFMSWNLGCALAPSWGTLLFFRTMAGLSASAPITVVSGIYADIYPDPEARGKAITMSLVLTTFGPVIAPAISGFVAPINWRWTFWISLIFSGCTLPFVLFLPETYAPLLLQRRAESIRKTSGIGKTVLTLSDFERQGDPITSQFTSLYRVGRLFLEPMIFVTCMFLAFEYAIYYLFFDAYPLIFEGIYHMSAGVAGLMFIPQGIGTLAAGLIFLWYDSFLHRAKTRGDAWTQNEEYRRLPLACVGGPLCVGALFWLGWSSRASVHWSVPMVAGFFYGCGIELAFVALLNYIADAYSRWTASAMACSAVSRSALAVVLPLATGPMFSRLGVAWALSLLGFISAGLSLAPFVFLRYGSSLRRRSKLCQSPDSNRGN